MRIAVFSYFLPTPGQKRGGVDRVAHDLAQVLALRGHEVTVFSWDELPPGALYRVALLRGKGLLASWLGRRLTMGYLGNLLWLTVDCRSFDVIISHGDSVLVPLLGKPMVRVMHGSGLGEAMSATTPWRFLLQSGVYTQELFSALTQPGCVAVSQNTVKHNPFVRRTIPLGVDLKCFYPAPAEKSPSPTILFVGALTGRKRGRLLIDWFTSKIRPLQSNAALLMVSEPGPQAAGVTYLTGVDDQTLQSLYRRAWVYASPSSYEGFGLPYLEAMASGTAVVATPNCGSREVLADGEYGLLARDEEFAAAINELIADPTRRRELEQRGVKRARELSLDRMGADYEALLYELTGGPAGQADGASCS